jgi:hypothetical protein
MTVLKPITQVFLKLSDRLEGTREGYDEIEHVRNVIKAGPEAVTPWFFFQQFVFVVICSYWKEQYARKEWDRYFESAGDLTCISNKTKRRAVFQVRPDYERWFKDMLAYKTPDERITFLQEMPMIGPVTSRHLARNIGIDCIKPDRHMNRLAAEFGYGASKKVEEQIRITTKMCRDIQEEIGDAEYLGTIDVILWRACNLGWI